MEQGEAENGWELGRQLSKERTQFRSDSSTRENGQRSIRYVGERGENGDNFTEIREKWIARELKQGRCGMV